MGLEASCGVTWQGKAWRAAVHLDSGALEVRGRPRLVLPLAEVRQVRVDGAGVTIDTARGTLILALGTDAKKWASKITAPPSRAKKLGLKPGQTVALVGLEDAALDAELETVGARLVSGRSAAELIFLGVRAPAELGALAALRRRIEPAGAIWVVRAKGKAATVKEGDVRDQARAAGLVDVKVVAFSETHSADKLVIPVSDRAVAGSTAGKPAQSKASKPAVARASAGRAPKPR